MAIDCVRACRCAGPGRGGVAGAGGMHAGTACRPLGTYAEGGARSRRSIREGVGGGRCAGGDTIAPGLSVLGL
jgi:hypothetical protein